MNIRSYNPTTILNNKIKISIIIKRTFDIIVSIIALIMLAPVFVLIAIAIKRDSHGPVFYRGSRYGVGGKPFEILKFRTMYETPESYAGPKVTAQGDPRITELGQWLRDTKLNELPQFWNVLIGDMSLVGPRPEDPSIAKTWPQKTRDEVLSVRPGITSPATVQYHNEEVLLNTRNVLSQYIKEIGPDKMRLDQLYVRYRSFWLDLDTLLWTTMILIPRVKEFSPPEKLLFVGPITRLIQRYLNWFSIDLLTTFSAIGFTGLFWRIVFGPLDLGWPRAVASAFGFAALFSLTGALFGMQRINWTKASLQDIFDIIRSWGVAFIIVLILNEITNAFSGWLILTASMLALAGFIFFRYPTRIISSFICRMTRFWNRVDVTRERVLVIGSGRTAEHLAWVFDHPTYSDKFKVVGFVDDNLLTQGMRIYGTDVRGVIDDIPDIVREQDVGIIAIADHRISTLEYRSKIMGICSKTPAKVVVVPDIFGSLRSLINSPRKGAHMDFNPEMQANPQCLHCLTKPEKFPGYLSRETMVDENKPVSSQTPFE
jgi:lipopolysaccharide/colanic/teichoic acid biosynthesis glycosyltransferase